MPRTAKAAAPITPAKRTYKLKPGPKPKSEIAQVARRQEEQQLASGALQQSRQTTKQLQTEHNKLKVELRKRQIILARRAMHGMAAGHFTKDIPTSAYSRAARQATLLEEELKKMVHDYEQIDAILELLFDALGEEV